MQNTSQTNGKAIVPKPERNTRSADRWRNELKSSPKLSEKHKTELRNEDQKVVNKSSEKEILKKVKQRWRSFLFYLITTSYLLMISPSELFFMEKPFPMTAQVLQSKLLTQKKGTFHEYGTQQGLKKLTFILPFQQTVSEMMLSNLNIIQAVLLSTHFL